eukprot:3887969-Rhodomonas_salina.2
MRPSGTASIAAIWIVLLAASRAWSETVCWLSRWNLNAGPGPDLSDRSGWLPESVRWRARSPRLLPALTLSTPVPPPLPAAFALAVVSPLAPLPLLRLFNTGLHHCPAPSLSPRVCGSPQSPSSPPPFPGPLVHLQRFPTSFSSIVPAPQCNSSLRWAAGKRPPSCDHLPPEGVWKRREESLLPHTVHVLCEKVGSVAVLALPNQGPAPL